MKKYTILLVENDELDVISVQRSLKKLDIGYELHTAYNGKEALTLLRENNFSLKPEVILLDLNMPKMNGVEFLKALRHDKRLKDFKVFIMTTSTEGTDRTITDQLGVAGYIIKPLNNDNTKKTNSMDAYVEFHLRKILTEEH